MALRNQEIGARLRELRGSKPQTTVADELGVAERTYQNWEAGDAKPSYRNLQRLAEYHGVGEEFILAGEGTAPTPRPTDTPDLSRPTSEDVLAKRLKAIEDALNAGRKERVDQAANIERLLKRQDAILETIQARLREQQAVRDEIADLIEAHGQGIVQGRPAAELDPAPVPPRSQAAATKRAAKQRTP